MGSFKNKINNNKKKKKNSALASELILLKKKMKKQYEDGEYVEAMDTMAEIAQHKKMDPEIMFMGANCYFNTGDYERAAKWTNHTLEYDPRNIGARLLLSRLCFVQDKMDDGFKLLNFVLEHFVEALSEKDQVLLMDMLEYCHDNMPDMMEQYPALVDYFNAHYVAPEIPGVQASIQDMLEASLPPKSVENNIEDEGKTKAQAAVDRLKSLLNKSRGNKTDGMQANSDVTPAGNHFNRNSDESPETIRRKVMESTISLRDKIQSLNNFAGGMYINDDYDGAFYLLKQALELDAKDPFVLKNMAYVLVAMKDKDKAMEYAAAMPMADFGLLKAIKGHCHG
ncbi:MAG: hypothetical protein K6C05_00510 [Anaerovibrio sp.]|uniref:tetratricopeptide repeat protein n=1 Tax=Anaerovibrio sp. TaxID=1872532 RepID=UPI0025E12202|nr:tetratricopeptide repeat protein [Anaerovibrio sp.]MCR5175311.1 hypothetical protein [Anaerovibrio sp.]